MFRYLFLSNNEMDYDQDFILTTSVECRELLETLVREWKEGTYNSTEYDYITEGLTSRSIAWGVEFLSDMDVVEW